MDSALCLGTYIHVKQVEGKRPLRAVYSKDINLLEYELLHYTEKAYVGRSIFIKHMGHANGDYALQVIFMDKERLLEILRELQRESATFGDFYSELVVLIAKLVSLEGDYEILVSYDDEL